MRVVLLFLAGFFVGMTSATASIDLANDIGKAVGYSLRD